MRSSTKHKVVLGALFLGIARVVSLRVKSVGILVYIRVVQSHIRSGNQHGALGDSIARSDGEVLLDQIGDHEHRRPVAQKFTNNSTGIGQGLELVHVEVGVGVTVANLHVLFADAVKNVGALGHDLEQPSGGTAGGILRSKEEGEDGLRDFVVAKHAEERRRLLAGILALLLCLAPALRLDHLDNPSVHDARDITTSGHANLALGSTLGKLSENHVGGPLAVPGLGVGDDNGEVDKLEGSSNEVIVVGNLLDGLVGDIVTDKGAAGNSAHELAELGHERNRLSVVFLGNIDKLVKVLLVDLFLAGQVAFESLAGKETVEALAEVNVSLAIEEDPVVMTEELVGDIDDTRLDVGGRVENLAGEISGGGNHNEPAKDTVG